MSFPQNPLLATCYDKPNRFYNINIVIYTFYNDTGTSDGDACDVRIHPRAALCSVGGVSVLYSCFQVGCNLSRKQATF